MRIRSSSQQARARRTRVEGRGSRVRADARCGHAAAGRATSRQSTARIDGEQLFQLHDTYGCPPDLIADILRERARELQPSTMADYERADGAAARSRARGGQVRRRHQRCRRELVAQLQPTEFLGYDALTAGGLIVVGLLQRRPAGRGMQCGRRGHRVARPHAVLCRKRRPGRRCRRARRRRPCVSRCATRRSSPASSMGTSAALTAGALQRRRSR